MVEFRGASFRPSGPGGAPRLVGAPRTVGVTAMTIADLAREEVVTSADVFRVTAGVKGKLGASWKWEAAGFYNLVKGKDNGYPNVRESRLLAAMLRTDQSAFNPFGYTFKVQGNAVVVDQPYKNPEAVVNSFSDTYSRKGQTYLASANVSGS